MYISDLASHHGTHILRPGETVAKMIPAERPTVLADGDTITFGKPVGKDESLVRPVTARVSLLFSIPSSSSTSNPSTEPVTPPAATSAAAHTGSSGRYGIYTPVMTSDSSSEDEIEEIPPLRRIPSVPPAPLPPCSAFPFGILRPPFFQQLPAHHLHHATHPHHTHRVSPTPSIPGRLGLLRSILPRLGSVEEISSHRGSTRMSPISISSDSRSSSVVEVSREEAQNSQSTEADLVGAFPDSSNNSRPASPVDDAGEDMDLESEPPSEYSSKPIGLDSLDVFEDSNVTNKSIPLLISSSRICTPEPSFMEEDHDDHSEMYATPPAEPPSFTLLPLNEDLAAGHAVIPWEDDDLIRAVDSLPSFPETPNRVSTPAADQFASGVESLKTRLADLEQRMYNPEQQMMSEVTMAPAETSHSSSHSDILMEENVPAVAAEEPSVMVDNLKGMIQGTFPSSNSPSMVNTHLRLSTSPRRAAQECGS